MPDDGFLLEAKAVTKSFGPTNVLKGVDFAVAAGEVHALLGGNGAGKSTLIKIITGTERRDGGALLYRGRDLDGSAGDAARAGGVAVVFQELALLPHLTVAENISTPHHRRGAAFFNEAKAYRAALDALSLIDREFALRAARRPVMELTLHERQMVEIARALSSGAQLLLLDEPTANLTALEAERLFAVIRRLTRDNGIGVVFVSHRMREIRQIADVCTIIRDGRSAVNRARLSTLSDADIVEQIGQAAATQGTEQGGIAPHVGGPPKKATMEVSRALRLQARSMELEIPVGAILGLAGAPAGPTLLIDQLTGARLDGRWRLQWRGRRRAFGSPRQAVRAGIGYVSGDRASKGVLASLPIIDNVMAARRVVRRQIFAAGSEIARTRKLLAALSIRARSIWSLPETLSGGTQQKLLLARWLALKPDLLVLEEPTRGVDISTKRDIYALIRQMSSEGTTVIWWSTENIELIELCDLVLAFNPDGEPTGMLRRGELSEERLVHATGMAA